MMDDDNQAHKNYFAAGMEFADSTRARACLLNLNIAMSYWAQKQPRGGQKSIPPEAEDFLRGLQFYQTHPYSRMPQNHSVLWRDGEARIVWYGVHHSYSSAPRGRIVMVPSLINSSEILDLLPGLGGDYSLIEWFNAQGFEVLLLQWGETSRDPDLGTLSAIIAAKLHRLMIWLQQFQSGKADKTYCHSALPLYGLGYCMGGTMLAAAASFHPDLFDRLIFVAAPWDFSSPASRTKNRQNNQSMNLPDALNQWMRSGGWSKLNEVSAMPHEWLHMIFAQLDPAAIVKKFSQFGKKFHPANGSSAQQNSLSAKLFVAVEDWIGSGGDLPTPLIRDVMECWYINNAPLHRQWTIHEKIVDLSRIIAPAFLIVPHKDRIVPPHSALAMAQHLRAPSILKTNHGHIAMMISGESRQNVWHPTLEWLND